jgi:hypothetical protein
MRRRPLIWLLLGLLPAASGGGLTPAAARTSGLCVDADQIVSRRAAGADALAFTLTGGREIVARLAAGCAHLDEIDRGRTLVFERREGSRLCAGDRFQLVDPVVRGAGGFPFCRVVSLARSPAAH